MKAGILDFLPLTTMENVLISFFDDLCEVIIESKRKEELIEYEYTIPNINYIEKLCEVANHLPSLECKRVIIGRSLDLAYELIGTFVSPYIDEFTNERVLSNIEFLSYSTYIHIISSQYKKRLNRKEGD